MIKIVKKKGDMKKEEKIDTRKRIHHKEKKRIKIKKGERNQLSSSSATASPAIDTIDTIDDLAKTSHPTTRMKKKMSATAEIDGAICLLACDFSSRF